MTVAVIEVTLAGFGVVKVAGVLITRLVLPMASGWKDVIALALSPANTTGLAMVPTDGTELERVRLTVISERSAWKDCTVMVKGSS